MNNPIVPPRTKFTPECSVPHPRVENGEQHVYKFPNGYGASVVRNPYSYGGPDGLYELGVLGIDGNLDTTTPVTNDVLGFLTDEHVNEALDWISRLPAAGGSND